MSTKKSDIKELKKQTYKGFMYVYKSGRMLRQFAERKNHNIL